MNTVTVAHQVTLFTHECISCGVVFAVTNEFDNRRRQDKNNFFCPNGHHQAYVKSDADRLREQLQAEQKKLANAQFELIAAKEKSQAAEKAKARLEKRIKNGVCPCCHRHFVQLTRHMKTKHPEFAE